MNINGIEIKSISKEIDEEKLREEYGHYDTLFFLIKETTDLDIGLGVLVNRYGSSLMVSIVCAPYQNFDTTMMCEGWIGNLNIKEVEDLNRLMKVFREKTIEYMESALNGGKDSQHFLNIRYREKILEYIRDIRNS